MRAWLEQRQAGKVPNYTVVKAAAEQATEQAHSLLSDVCSATEAETIVKQLCQQCECEIAWRNDRVRNQP